MPRSQRIGQQEPKAAGVPEFFAGALYQTTADVGQQEGTNDTTNEPLSQVVYGPQSVAIKLLHDSRSAHGSMIHPIRTGVLLSAHFGASSVSVPADVGDGQYHEPAYGSPPPRVFPVPRFPRATKGTAHSRPAALTSPCSSRPVMVSRHPLALIWDWSG